MVVPADEQLRRYRVETLKIEADACQAALDTYNRMLSQAAAEADERDKLYFKDAARNFVRSCFPATGDHPALEGTSNEHVTISDVARDMGVRLHRGDESRVAKLAAELYRNKHQRCVDGAVQPVNLYFGKDRDVLEQAIASVVGLTI